MKKNTHKPAAPQGGRGINVGSPRPQNLRTVQEREGTVNERDMISINLRMEKLKCEVDSVLRKRERHRLKIQELKSLKARLISQIENKRRLKGKNKTQSTSRANKPKRIQNDTYEKKFDSVNERLNKVKERDRKLRETIIRHREEKIRIQEDLEKIKMECVECTQKKHLLIKNITKKQKLFREKKDAIFILKKEVNDRVNIMKQKWKQLGNLVEAKTDKEKEKILKNEIGTDLDFVGEPQVQRTEKINSTLQQTSLGQRPNHNPVTGTTSNSKSDFNHEKLPLSGHLTLEEEKGIRKQISKSNWQIARGQATLQTLEGKIVSFQEGFEIIQERTGVKSTEEMIKNFIEREEENYRLFSFVNILSERIEDLEKNIDKEKTELEKFRGKEDEEGTEQSMFKSLEKRLQFLHIRHQKETENIERSKNVIGKAKDILFRILKILDIDSSLCWQNQVEMDLGLQNMIRNHSRVSFSYDVNVRYKSDEGGQGNDAGGTYMIPKTGFKKHVPGSKMQQSMSPRKRKESTAEVKEDNDQCVNSETREMMALDPSFITEHNIMKLLGLIEQRVIEVIMLQSIGSSKRGDNGDDLSVMSVLVTKQEKNHIKQHIPVLPSIDSEQDWQDEDDFDGEKIKPLKQSEIRTKIKQVHRDRNKFLNGEVSGTSGRNTDVDINIPKGGVDNQN